MKKVLILFAVLLVMAVCAGCAGTAAPEASLPEEPASQPENPREVLTLDEDTRNDYFNALIYLKDEALKPLQVLLKEVLSATGSSISDIMDSTDYLKNYVNGERIKYVLIIVSCLPIMLVYPFIQKYFVKGVMLGSVKG